MAAGGARRRTGHGDAEEAHEDEEEHRLLHELVHSLRRLHRRTERRLVVLHHEIDVAELPLHWHLHLGAALSAAALNLRGTNMGLSKGAASELARAQGKGRSDKSESGTHRRSEPLQILPNGWLLRGKRPELDAIRKGAVVCAGLRLLASAPVAASPSTSPLTAPPSLA